MDSVLSRDCDEDTQTLIQSVSRGRPFPTWYFDTVSPKFVKKILMILMEQKCTWYTSVNICGMCQLQTDVISEC